MSQGRSEARDGIGLQFTADETAPKKSKNRKLNKAEQQCERINGKLEKARENLPTKSKLRSRRVFNEETGKAQRKLYFEKEVKTQKEHLKGSLPLRPIKAGIDAAIINGHRKIYQVEDENVEVKAAHRGEMITEGGVRALLRHHKVAPYRKVAKLEHEAMKKQVNLTYRQALEKTSKQNNNMLSRMFQKQKIKNDYAKKLRDTQKSAKHAKAAIEKTGSLAAKGVNAIANSPRGKVVLFLAGLLLLLTMSMCSTVGGLGSGGFGGILNGVFLAEDEDIDQAALAYSKWETDLQLEILHAETTHSGYDEYRYAIGAIGHDPLALMAFLTAMYYDFTYGEVESPLREVFNEQYTLAFSPSMEIRYRTETRTRTRTNPVTGDTYEVDYTVQVPYDWHILTVTLTSQPFINVISSHMEEEQLQHYDILMQTRGARNYAGSPFDFDWLPFVTSHYGYRVHPIRGDEDLHSGIDIGLAAGTGIQSAQDGTVTYSGYLGDYGNVVIIENEDGLVTKYAHCETLLVSEGQPVAKGDIIAKVGSTGSSTGPHLHFEVIVDGFYRNPLFFSSTSGE